MPLTHVDLLCPRCQMFCKPEHKKVEIERTEDRVAYGHERCYRLNEDGEGRRGTETGNA